MTLSVDLYGLYIQMYLSLFLLFLTAKMYMSYSMSWIKKIKLDLKQ